MSWIIAAAAAAAAASGPPPSTAAEPQPAKSDRAAALAQLPAADLDIEKALWRALESNPERVVCSARVETGSRQQQQTCGSLRRWFDARTPGEVADKRAPWQLIEEIKEQRRKALAKSRRGGA